MAWRVFAAAATGKSHLDTGTPCQDAFHSTQVGGMLLAVVCDGAGSQSQSHLGAATLSQGVVQALAQRLHDSGTLPLHDAQALHAIVADAIATVRGALERVAVYDGGELQQFAATLVGVLADAGGGAFFHVGDGQGVAELVDDSIALSLPENGEYANETYFVTGEAWREHLRITPFAPGATRVALMSDGAASFALDKGQRALFRPFVDPVCAWLAATSDDAVATAGLHATLDDERTHRITGDDKALLLALRA